MDSIVARAKWRGFAAMESITSRENLRKWDSFQSLDSSHRVWKLCLSTWPVERSIRWEPLIGHEMIVWEFGIRILLIRVLIYGHSEWIDHGPLYHTIGSFCFGPRKTIPSNMYGNMAGRDRANPRRVQTREFEFLKVRGAQATAFGLLSLSWVPPIDNWIELN